MKIDFEKMGGLVPAIIQDATTKNVLMLGFMNEEAYQKTLEICIARITGQIFKTNILAVPLGP